MKSLSHRWQAGAALAPALLLALSGCIESKKTDVVQVGYRGVAMEQNYNHSEVVDKFKQVKIPAPLPPAGEAPPGPLPWRNVQVLNDVSPTEFLRTMTAMSTWVAGTGNCAYCHNVAALWSDTLPNGKPIYTKLVARRMLQMTRHINGQYPQHVKNTGVTCYTCHLGKPLPNGLWFYTDQTDYLRHYLDRDGARVVSQQMAPSAKGNRSSVKQTEWTYALMISQSKSLGVNCTYCHNSRQFASWTQAPPARVTAYHGILMLRDLNTQYLSPLQTVYPTVRLGSMGDAPKAQCVTCHNGNYKPLYGAQMAKYYPALWGRSEWNGVPFKSYGTAKDTSTTKADSAMQAMPASTTPPIVKKSAKGPPAAGAAAVQAAPSGGTR